MTAGPDARWIAAVAVVGLLAVGRAQEPPRLGLPVPPLAAGPFEFDTAEQQRIRVRVLVRGLSHPWSLAFMPDGSMLVTERPGRLRLVRDGRLDPIPIAGVPRVRTDGNGGLMDVALHPRFAENRWIYLTYTKPVENGRGTPALARGRLDGKVIGNAIGLAVTMVLAQGVIAYLITALVLGVFLPIPGFLAGLGVQMANILFYMTMTLMFGAIFDHPAPVIGIPMAFLFVQQFLVSSVPALAKILPWGLVMPTNNGTELPMATALMQGEPVASYLPLIGTLMLSALFVVIALVIFLKQEL